MLISLHPLSAILSNLSSPNIETIHKERETCISPASSLSSLSLSPYPPSASPPINPALSQLPLRSLTSTLKTATPQNASSQKKDLYLTLSRIEPSAAGVTFKPDRSKAVTAFLNGTLLQFDRRDDLNWSLSLKGSSDYTAWQLVSVDGGFHDDGFSLDSLGVLHFDKNKIGGWVGWIGKCHGSFSMRLSQYFYFIRILYVV